MRHSSLPQELLISSRDILLHGHGATSHYSDRLLQAFNSTASSSKAFSSLLRGSQQQPSLVHWHFLPAPSSIKAQATKLLQLMHHHFMLHPFFLWCQGLSSFLCQHLCSLVPVPVHFIHKLHICCQRHWLPPPSAGDGDTSSTKMTTAAIITLVPLWTAGGN